MEDVNMDTSDIWDKSRDDVWTKLPGNPKTTTPTPASEDVATSEPEQSGSTTSKVGWVCSIPSMWSGVPARNYRSRRESLPATILEDVEVANTSETGGRNGEPDHLGWGYVQERLDLNDVADFEDCPSLFTGSTISSRNSSLRSARSFRPDSQGFSEPHHQHIDAAHALPTQRIDALHRAPSQDGAQFLTVADSPIRRTRYTVRHVKRKMTCGFCTAGVSVRKVFYRSDAFMEHLVVCHGAIRSSGTQGECAPSMSHAEASSGLNADEPTATCTLCDAQYNVQGFYEHLPQCSPRRSSQDLSTRRRDLQGSGPSPLIQEVLPEIVPEIFSVAVDAQASEPASTPGPPAAATSADASSRADTLVHEASIMDELEASSRCLSLASSDTDETKSSDEETDWTEDTGTPASEVDTEDVPPILSPFKRQLVETIMQEFHQVFDNLLRKSAAGGGSSSGHGYYSASSGSSAPSTSSYTSRKRSHSGDGSIPPNDNGDDPNKRRRPDPGNDSKSPAVELRFACPFYKRNPGRHQTFTSCRDPGFITVARLKEHLYRRHLLPIQCNRCCATFTNEPALREHQRDTAGCEIKEQVPLEGFNKDQERKLKSKKRSVVYQSEEDKWKGVYRILFPDDADTDTPSPYIEYQPCNGSSAEPSNNIARFQDFSRLELPRLVRRTLEAAIEEEAQPIEEKMKERLVDIVRECQTQLIHLYQTTQASEVDAEELQPTLVSLKSPTAQPFVDVSPSIPVNVPIAVSVSIPASVPMSYPIAVPTSAAFDRRSSLASIAPDSHFELNVVPQAGQPAILHTISEHSSPHSAHSAQSDYSTGWPIDVQQQQHHQQQDQHQHHHPQPTMQDHVAFSVGDTSGYHMGGNITAPLPFGDANFQEQGFAGAGAGTGDYYSYYPTTQDTFAAVPTYNPWTYQEQTPTNMGMRSPQEYLAAEHGLS